MNTDVLILGAGPTGLTAAIELARRGIKCRLLDKAAAPNDKSRALAIQARTLEIFKLQGIVDKFLERGYRAKNVGIFVEGKRRVTADFSTLHAPGTDYMYIFVLSQAETEKILTEKLASLGVSIERSCEALDFTMNDRGVTTHVRNSSGATETIESKYILGADGAHSFVRHQLKLDFAGDAYQQRFLLADATVDWDLPDGEFEVFLGKTGVCVFFPFKTMKTGRFIIADHDPDDKELTLAEIEQNVKFYAERDLKLSNPVWISQFRLHHRVANKYRVNRAFLAGDAAHIHSPAGGQGMNTGIQDAFNLAWKLALVIQGGAKPKLLDSYEAERRPIGLKLLERTDRFFTVAASNDRKVTRIRNFVFKNVAPLALRFHAARLFLFKFVSQLGIRYSRSMLNRDIAANAPKSFTEALPPGWRVPSTIQDDCKQGSYFHLFLLGEADERTRDAWLQEAIATFADRSELVKCHALAPSDELRQLMGAEAPCSYLVRPDQHVMFRTYGKDLNETKKNFDALF